MIIENSMLSYLKLTANDFCHVNFIFISINRKETMLGGSVPKLNCDSAGYKSLPPTEPTYIRSSFAPFNRYCGLYENRI